MGPLSLEYEPRRYSFKAVSPRSLWPTRVSFTKTRHASVTAVACAGGIDAGQLALACSTLGPGPVPGWSRHVTAVKIAVSVVYRSRLGVALIYQKRSSLAFCGIRTCVDNTEHDIPHGLLSLAYITRQQTGLHSATYIALLNLYRKFMRQVATLPKVKATVARSFRIGFLVRHSILR